MKVSAQCTPIPAFNPVTLTVTVESLDELRELYHRLNIGITKVRAEAIGSRVPAPTKSHTYDLWDEIDELLI